MSIVDWIKEHLLNHNVEALEKKVEEGLATLTDSESLERMKEFKDFGKW